MTTCSRAVLSCCLFTFLTSSLFAQLHYQRLAMLDVQHYKFDIVLQDIDNQIKGTASVAVRFLKPISRFSLDLVKKNASGKGMTVTAVTLDGAPLSFEQKAATIDIQLSQATVVNELYVFRIVYQGIPTDGLIIDKNKFGNRTFFGDNWPDRAHHWLPVVDHPSDKASVEFVVTAPEHYQVVANGLQLEESNLPNGLKLTRWLETQPIPTKVMVFGAAAFATQLSGEVHGIPLMSWVYPENRQAGFNDYAPAQDPLDFFINHIGPYPFRKLANVQSKTRFGGMENAGCIFYFENSVTGNQGLESLLAHEIAHQWFGNSASEANWHHVWLSEGFATYFTDLFIEHAHGRAAMVEHLKEERRDVLDFATRRFKPVVDTTITDYQNELLSTNVYQKGGWILHMLRHELGDEVFWEGIRAYYQKYQFSNALTDDFRLVMEQTSGKKLGAFFQQWLFTAEHPKLKSSWAYDAATKELTIQIVQTQRGVPFQFPLELGVFFSDQLLPVIKTCRIAQQEEKVVFKLDKSPTEVVLDPEAWLLFEGVGK